MTLLTCRERPFRVKFNFRETWVWMKEGGVSPGSGERFAPEPGAMVDDCPTSHPRPPPGHTREEEIGFGKCLYPVRCPREKGTSRIKGRTVME